MFNKPVTKPLPKPMLSLVRLTLGEKPQWNSNQNTNFSFMKIMYVQLDLCTFGFQWKGTLTMLIGFTIKSSYLFSPLYGYIACKLHILWCLNLRDTMLFALKHGLTHWGRVTHICVSKLTITGSDNGLSPDRRKSIIWTNAGILLIGPLGTNFSEILIEILTFSLKKMRLKVSSAKRRPFCLGLNVLIQKILCRICVFTRRLSETFLRIIQTSKGNRNATSFSYKFHWNCKKFYSKFCHIISSTAVYIKRLFHISFPKRGVYLQSVRSLRII